VGRRIEAFWVLATALFVSVPALAAFDAAFDEAPFEVTAETL
jgi:hypothetical protein